MSGDAHARGDSSLQLLDSGARGFHASLMDGPDLCLFRLVGFADREDVEEATWRYTNWKALIEECGSATIVEVGDFDEMPGQSDVFYEVQVDDEAQFIAELRSLMLDYVDRARREDAA